MSHGHDWIFDVLKDLRSYAERNGLPLIAEKTEELIALARAEVAGRAPGDGDPPQGRIN